MVVPGNRIGRGGVERGRRHRVDVPSSQLEQTLVRLAGFVRTAPAADVVYVELHEDIPPFDDVNARRAVNLALDRQRVVEILGGEVAALATCQQIPPNFPGYRPYCPYSVGAESGDGLWRAPDLERAHALVRRSGTQGMRVTYSFDPRMYGCCEEALAEYVVQMLGSLGYRATARPVPQGRLYDTRNRFQMAFTYYAADYPSPATFIAAVFTCQAPVNTSSFCDPRIDAMVEQAIRVQARDAIAALSRWSEIDHALVDQAPHLWLVNTVAADLLSKQVGNYQRHPQWGALLGQIWVR